MAIFQRIKNSVYNPQFYADQKPRPTRFAFGYFTKLLLLQVLILTIVFSILVIPRMLKVISAESIDGLINFYPAELQVTLTKGQVSTNVKEPYSIPVATSTNRTTVSGYTSVKNIFVIDTKTPFTLDNFAKYDTAVLLTKEYIVSQKSSGQITIQKLSSFPDMTINRSLISSWVAQVVPYLKFLVPIAIVGIFAGLFVFGYVSNLFLILIVSLIIFIVNKIRRAGLSYGDTFKLGLYAITPVVILDAILMACGLDTIWYVNTLLLILVFFTNVKLVNRTSVPTA